MHLPDKEEVKETLWRLKCKTFRYKDEKTLSDFSDTASDDLDSAADAGKANATAAGDGSGPLAAKDNNGFGSAVVVKTMYESSMDRYENIVWKDYPPRQLSKSEAKAQDRVAIKIYKVKDSKKPVINGRYALKYHKLDIQNPQLVAALEPILKADEMHLDPSETATFKYPFRPLYFCYDAIVAKLRSLSPQDQLHPYMKLLVNVLDEVFANIRAKQRQLAGRGLVSFEHAWVFFPRGSVVRSRGANCDVLSRVLDTAYGKASGLGGAPILKIRTQVLQFNGEAFVWEKQELEMGEFEGNQLISTFDHCPLSHLPDEASIKKRLIDRGRLVLDYQGLSYCQYTGLGIHRVAADKIEKHNIDGRILVDVVGYKKHHLAQGVREGKDEVNQQNVVRGTGRRNARRAPPRKKLVHRRPHHHHDDETDSEDEEEIIKRLESMTRLDEEEQAANKAAMLENPDDLMFMSPLLEAYALKNKLWVMLYVEDIRPLKWNDQAYDHLVYDEQQKDMVLSFVENHGHNKTKMEDVILGKGDGLIILLSGPPGTGKTLTAEAVADRTHRPLFYLQAEDLGVSAATLGANVKKVFEMATEWDAVILLDEADVFMAERHPQDIARNELVSIFLRELEYFRGIIFLTTNLYETIDSAFRSRVSLHLLFKPLTPEARLSVWQKFLARVVPDEEVARKMRRSQRKRLAAAAENGPGDTGKGSESNAGSSSSEATKTSAVVEGGSSSTPASTPPDAHSLREEAAPEVVPFVSKIDQEDLQELSAWALNGREIKTAVKMVTSWCSQKGYELTLERLENGIRVTSPHASKSTPATEADELYN